MMVDHRTDDTEPGNRNQFPELFEAEELPLRLDCLGHRVGGYMSNDSGRLDRNVHRWDQVNCEAYLGKLVADPRWQQFLEKVGPLLDRMENKILRPAPYFTPPELEGQG